RQHDHYADDDHLLDDEHDFDDEHHHDDPPVPWAEVPSLTQRAVLGAPMVQRGSTPIRMGRRPARGPSAARLRIAARERPASAGDSSASGSTSSSALAAPVTPRPPPYPRRRDARPRPPAARPYMRLLRKRAVRGRRGSLIARVRKLGP